MKTGILLKMIFFIFLTSLMVFAAFAGNDSTPFGTAAPELYWLSYVENGKGVFLMQIDSTGNVIRAPVFMGEFGPAISHNGVNKINLWGWEQRVVINKKTVSIAKKVKNAIGSPNSITNKTQKNFAAVVGEKPLSLKFFGVSPTGVPNGATWEMTSREYGFCGYVFCAPGAVSSDGKVAFWLVRELEYPTGLYIQQLSDTGRPDGSQSLVNIDGDAIDGALSNVLTEGRIYFVLPLWFGNDGFPSQLILQAVDAQTGQKIGDKILLKEARFGHQFGSRSVAIDPLGRFVIYAHQNQQNVHFLSFLALDATGHRSGTSKVLVRKVDATNIHLLKD